MTFTSFWYYYPNDNIPYGALIAICDWPGDGSNANGNAGGNSSIGPGQTIEKADNQTINISITSTKESNDRDDSSESYSNKDHTSDGNETHQDEANVSTDPQNNTDESDKATDPPNEDKNVNSGPVYIVK